jgi:hypothetical protein
MGKALDRTGDRTVIHASRKSDTIDWRKKMSDNVAYALLTYTGLQIGVTMTMLKGSSGSIMPYFALVLLIAAIIPAARLFESRWSELSDAEAAEPSLASAFTRDRLALWLSALGLPFALAAFFTGVEALLG